MKMNLQTAKGMLGFVFLFGSNFAAFSQTRVSSNHTTQPIETTVTALVKSPAKFNGKRVHLFASFHTDGLHLSNLMEPNCGILDGTSKTPPPNQPPCARAIAAANSAKSSNDEGDQALDVALAKGERGTSDKHITAEFIGVFRCGTSCKSPKHLKLEIERTENVNVEMKDMKPHHPTS